MKYRREIDGLRALAVLPVILFHAGFSTFGGGFVGVDVFFVISGYLITTLIVGEKEAGRFSILRFYERRARRILPALFLVVAACMPFAWMWLLPGDFKSFAESEIAVALFSSNVLFWRESGYFATAAAMKPLHHTWSLAVEEQYYVLFPLFLGFIWRFGRRALFLALVVVAAASLFAAEWGSVRSPTFTFFLLPTRAWELLGGAMIALYLGGRTGVGAPRGAAEAAGAIGLAALAYAVFAFSSRTPFPSFHALVPTVGTGLIILFATPSTVVGRVLGHRWLVGLGLISYSAYLWHQPLFAFARHASLDSLSTTDYLGLSALALVLAFLSWKFVETPFRDRQRISARGVWIFSITGTAVMIAAGVAGYVTNGSADRFGGERREFFEYFEDQYPDWKMSRRTNRDAVVREDCNFYDMAQFRARPATDRPRKQISADCHVRDNRYAHAVFIWGDSHAQQLYPGLKNSLPADWQLMQVATSACEPSPDISKVRGASES